MPTYRLHQGFVAGGMGSDNHFAWQQSAGPNVRFGSKADIMHRSKEAFSFNQLIGTVEQLRWNGETKRFCGL
jgi:hypothetical protein